jgi:protein-L-isoaspartate O-methyltransferase
MLREEIPMTTPTFDAQAYKATTRDQWQAAATAWDNWGPTIEKWLGPATDTMLDLAGVSTGCRVLDVAAGSGGQTLVAARRVGPDGRVLATDIAPAILALAEHNARAAGLTNVAVRVMDGEQLEVEPGCYDAAISRVGLIYFPDRIAALQGIRRALRSGGRHAALVYSTPVANTFFSIPISVIRERANLAPPPPGAPGPFCLGNPGVAEQALADAGFVDVSTVRLDAPVRLPSTADFVRFAQESFGALHQMMAGLDQAGRDATWAEIADRLKAFEGPDGWVGPCEMIVVAGTAP